MIKVIPAIDIINGQAVRLEKGAFESKKVYTDPLSAAKQWQTAGAKLLHIVDLDGAKTGKQENLPLIKELIEKTGIAVQSGGGLRSISDLKALFAAGVGQAVIGSLAVKQPELVRTWLTEFPGKIIIGADIRNGFISISGWQEASSINILEFITQWQAAGAKDFLITDIAQDGTLAGPNIDLYQELLQKFPNLHIIASGGVGSDEDILALDGIGVPSVIVGKAIYEGKVDLKMFFR